MESKLTPAALGRSIRFAVNIMFTIFGEIGSDPPRAVTEEQDK